jgi:hypothetical protein
MNQSENGWHVSHSILLTESIGLEIDHSLYSDLIVLDLLEFVVFYRSFLWLPIARIVVCLTFDETLIT